VGIVGDGTRRGGLWTDRGRQNASVGGMIRIHLDLRGGMRTPSAFPIRADLRKLDHSTIP